MIRIKARRRRVGDNYTYELVSVTMLRKEQLPKKYIKTYPHCYKTDAGLRCTNRPYPNVLKTAEWKIGAVIPEERFARCIQFVRACGNRLHAMEKDKVKTIEVTI